MQGQVIHAPQINPRRDCRVPNSKQAWKTNPESREYGPKYHTNTD